MAVDDFGFVLVPRRRGAIRVQDHGPAPLVNDNLVVKETEQGAVFDAGRAAVLAVPQVVDLATRALTGWPARSGSRSAARRRRMRQLRRCIVICVTQCGTRTVCTAPSA